MKRFLRHLMYRISDAYYTTVGALNADKILLGLIARRDEAKAAVERCYTAVRRLESKGQKGSDTWHVENAFMQVHQNEVGNMNGAIITQKEYVDQQKSLTIKTIRWLRDWVY